MQTTLERAAPPDESVHPVARLSWRAILAGSIASLSITWLLLSLGGAVGLTAMEPARGDLFVNPAGAAGVGIWTVVAVGIGSFLGGLISVRASSIVERADAVIQGLTTWAFGFLFSAVFAGFLAAVAGAGAFSGVGDRWGADDARTPPAAARDRGLDAGAGATWVVFASGLVGAICGMAGGAAGLRRSGGRTRPSTPAPVGRPAETPAV